MSKPHGHRPESDEPKPEPEVDLLAVKPGDELHDLAYLGREFLTWLLFRCDQGESSFGEGDDEFTLTFVSKVRLDAVAGDVTTAVLKGGPAAHSAMARAAIGAGCIVREAELKASRGEKSWLFTLVADTFDIKSAKIPAELTEEDDERFLERMALILELDSLVKAAYRTFLRERARPAWRKAVVPALREWVVEGLRVLPSA